VLTFRGGGTEAAGRPRAVTAVGWVYLGWWRRGCGSYGLTSGTSGAEATVAACRPQAMATTSQVDLGQRWAVAQRLRRLGVDLGHSGYGLGRPRAMGDCAKAAVAAGQPRVVAAAAGQPQMAAVAVDRPRVVRRWYLDSERRRWCLDPKRRWWRLDDPERWRASFLPHPMAALEALAPPPSNGID
jgi:hypothetical protein